MFSGLSHAFVVGDRNDETQTERKERLFALGELGCIFPGQGDRTAVTVVILLSRGIVAFRRVLIGYIVRTSVESM